MKAQERLAHILESGQIPHALLFAGPKGTEKLEAAYHFATTLLATRKKPEDHPDIHLLIPEGKIGIHSIEAIRQLAQDAALSPYEGEWRVYIIEGADKMLPTSSNALLKTLEEPTSHTLIILISDEPGRLLPTILSRCQMLEFHPTKAEKIQNPLLPILAGETPLTNLDGEDPHALFETLLFWYRDRLLVEIGGCESYLHYPHYLPQLKVTPLVPLEIVEKGILLARLAHERSTKLSTCLEMFFLFIK